MASHVEVSTVSESHLQYRSLSLSAVATMVLALTSLAALIVPALLIIPLIGTFVGILSVVKIRKNIDQLCGLNLARVGFGLCLLLLVGGTGLHSYIYATEVPEGFDRIDFSVLQQDDENSRLPVPRSAIELDGQPVFLKGYVHPSSGERNLKQFVLVPDMGTCCFGGQPKLTDMVEVTLKGGKRIDYSFARRKLAGTLKVSTQKKRISGLDGVYYQLDAEYVK